MRRYLTVLFALFFLCTTVFAQTQKIYQLVEVLSNSGFDYEWLKNIDSIKPPYPSDSDFQIGDLKIIPGEFTLYKFICVYYGQSKFATAPTLFHDLLIIKTGNDKKILDAYHYTLEWIDAPTLDLYKMKAKDVVLQKGLLVKELKLANKERNELNDDGILDNILDGKKVF